MKNRPVFIPSACKRTEMQRRFNTQTPLGVIYANTNRAGGGKPVKKVTHLIKTQHTYKKGNCSVGHQRTPSIWSRTLGVGTPPGNVLLVMKVWNFPLRPGTKQDCEPLELRSHNSSETLSSVHYCCHLNHKSNWNFKYYCLSSLSLIKNYRFSKQYIFDVYFFLWGGDFSVQLWLS